MPTNPEFEPVLFKGDPCTWNGVTSKIDKVITGANVEQVWGFWATFDGEPVFFSPRRDGVYRAVGYPANGPACNVDV